MGLTAVQARSACSRPTSSRRLIRHLVAHALGHSRHTITSLLHTSGRAHLDWSSDYRLYGDDLSPAALFAPILDAALQLLPPDAPLVVAIDDSMVSKSGRCIPGAGWYRDSKSPGFHTNLVYGLRFVQLSLAIPHPHAARRARMIPIALAVIPKAPPSHDPADHKTPSPHSPSAHGITLLKALRGHLDALPLYEHRPVRVCGDGAFTGGTMLRELPPHTTYVGRTRGDLHLCDLPAPCKGPGRRPDYGEKMPTPEALRKDKSVPWQQCLLTKEDGTQTRIRFKHLPLVKWRMAGPKKHLQLVVVAGLRYRKREGGKDCYTQPAFLLSDDPHLPVKDLLQSYFWRWEIEVNFRDQKQLFGMGHAQVRHPDRVFTALAVPVASYAALLLAGLQTYGFDRLPLASSTPKWRRKIKRRRLTTSDLLAQIRFEASSLLFSPFVSDPPALQSPPNSSSSLSSSPAA